MDKNKHTLQLHLTGIHGFYAFLLGISLLFYLFFAFLDGAVIAVDSESYINMEISREPLYPMLLALFRMLFRSVLPLAGEDFYLTAIAFFQSILMALAAWCLATYLGSELHLPKTLTTLLFCIPLVVSLLCRFAAGRESMYSNSILTEGIAIPMYLIFFRNLLEFCLHQTKKSFVLCSLFSFLLYSTRKQMVIALAMLMLSLLGLYALGKLPAGKKKDPDASGGVFKRIGKGIGFALILAVVVLGSSTLFDIGYNYVVRGEAVRHSSDSRFVTTMVFYTAEREDADYIEDEEIRELFLEIYDACDEQGYLGHSAGDGWLNRVSFFGDHYDNIQIDTMWPAINTYVSEKYGGNTVAVNITADDVMDVINFSVGPHNMGRILSAFWDNVLSGLVTTVAQRKSILIVYSIFIYLFYLVLWILCAAGKRQDAKEKKVFILAALTLLSIACNVGLVSLVIFCQTRYTIYNMPLFYMSLLLLLYENAPRRKRNKEGRALT